MHASIQSIWWSCGEDPALLLSFSHRWFVATNAAPPLHFSLTVIGFTYSRRQWSAGKWYVYDTFLHCMVLCKQLLFVVQLKSSASTTSRTPACICALWRRRNKMMDPPVIERCCRCWPLHYWHVHPFVVCREVLSFWLDRSRGTKTVIC